MNAVTQSREREIPEVGIYKRKQESKKTRKHTFNQECDQEKKEKTITVKKKTRKHAFHQESDKEKKKKTRSRPRKRPR